jgi:hypothetical protein
LSALHTYISKLYYRTQEVGDEKVWKFMDETALIALGILAEEMTNEVLGDTGDFALVEAARSDEEDELVDEKREQMGMLAHQESEEPNKPSRESSMIISSSNSGSGYSSGYSSGQEE